MPAGGGANWNGDQGPTSSENSIATAGGTVNFEVRVVPSNVSLPAKKMPFVVPPTGLAQFEIVKDVDTPVTIAKKLADAWNLASAGTQNLAAVANGPLTAFFMTGDLAKEDAKKNPLYRFAWMAVTFPEKPRDQEELGNSVQWANGGIKVDFVHTVPVLKVI